MNDQQKENIKIYIKEVLRKEVTKVRDIVRSDTKNTLRKFIELIKNKINKSEENAIKILNDIQEEYYYFKDSIYNFIIKIYNYKITTKDISEISKNKIIPYNKIKKYIIDYLKNEYKNNRTGFEKFYRDSLLTKWPQHMGETSLFFNPKKEKNKVVRNQWLVHFSSQVESIVHNGFIYGVDNPENLGHTGIYLNMTGDTKKRKDSVYVFSYRLDEFIKENKDIPGFGEFGGGAIMFRSNGLQIFSDVDNENQVISYSNDARNIVGIKNIYVEQKKDFYWVIYKPNENQKQKLPYFKKLKDCMMWISQNYDQYKNVLSVR
jgi:hypothetical protein